MHRTLVLAASVAVLAQATVRCRLQDEALMFIKPHAMRPEVRELVLNKIREKGLEVVGEGHRSAEGISRNNHIDSHYGVIASRAMSLHPSELRVSADAAARFEKVMGVVWSEALKDGTVYNAKQAMAKLDVDSKVLDSRWNTLKKGEDLVKLGSGFYVGRVAQDVFVVNGFFLSMREEYVSGPGIHYLQVGWPRNSSMSWSSFRSDLLGATDPTSANEGSIRRALHDDYAALGLPDRPHTGTNGVHASASALEAMVERMNWLGTDIADDPMGRALLEAGVSVGSVQYWSKDPVVEFEGKRQSVFDLVEDMGAAECLKVLTQLGGRDCPGSMPGAGGGGKDLVPCGFFAWRSISDHSVAVRKRQCRTRALVCAGHFEKSFKSVSDHTLATRRKECNSTSLVPCGYQFRPELTKQLAKCNETALVPCGHFEQSFKSTGEQTLKERLEQCNETALVPCGHFERSFRTLSDHSVKCLTVECQEQAILSMESMLGSDGDTEGLWGEGDEGEVPQQQPVQKQVEVGYDSDADMLARRTSKRVPASTSRGHQHSTQLPRTAAIETR